MKGGRREERRRKEKKQRPISQVPLRGCTRAQSLVAPGKATSANPRHSPSVGHVPFVARS